LFAQSPQPSPTPPKPGQKIQQPSSGESQNSEARKKAPEKASAPVVLLQPAQGDRKSQASNNKPSNPPPDDRIVWFTLALVIVAVFQFIAMIFQACYMRQGLRIAGVQARAALENAQAAKDNARAALDAAETAKRQSVALINSERAWLIISEVGPVKLNPKAGLTEFRFTLTNRGRTVARLAPAWMRHDFKTVPGGSALPDTPYYGDQAKAPSEEFVDPAYGRVLAPGESTKEIDIGYVEDIDGDLFKAIQQRGAHLYFYAIVLYFDFADQGVPVLLQVRPRVRGVAGTLGVEWPPRVQQAHLRSPKMRSTHI
jgi:hypothetical protein